jgi:hypothetical protein
MLCRLGRGICYSGGGTWTPELLKAFKECKTSFSRATLLAHPNPSAPLALVTDASTSAVGAVLQQHVNDAWQPIAFSKKLNPAQQKYSAYDRELLAIYEAVKHFRHAGSAFPSDSTAWYIYELEKNKFLAEVVDYSLLLLI